MINAVLIALPVSRIVGPVLGAVIIAAAVLTVLRHRDFSHLMSTHGGLYVWEFEKGGRELKVRVEGQLI